MLASLAFGFNIPSFVSTGVSLFRGDGYDTTQRQLRVSYNHFWFMSIVLKKIMPVILVVFSLNDGVLATVFVLEKSVPRGKISVL